jgi:hypothetical protein
MSNFEFPLRHVSIRVPWHDAGWSGVVCRAPQLNGACGKLKRIADGKKDGQEVPIAGRSFEDLPRAQWPRCVDERVTFMAPFEMEQVKTHALADVNRQHYSHFRPTPQRYPSYSAGIVPFLWMMRKNLNHYRDLLALDVDEEREPDLGYETNWTHEAQNQTALLGGVSRASKKRRIVVSLLRKACSLRGRHRSYSGRRWESERDRATIRI